MSADDVLAASTGSGSAPARGDAEDFLREMLADGPITMKKIEADALDVGLAWKTVYRAKTTLGVKSIKTGVNGGWEWSLPRNGQR
jgi:putative DNA primase/helicase